MSSSSAPNTEPPTVQPPRPPNAWILYLSDKCRELKERGEGRAFATQSKEIGAMWQRESVAVRELYAARAKEAARQHRLRYPEYRFHPVKKAAKEAAKREREEQREEARGGRGYPEIVEVQQPWPSVRSADGDLFPPYHLPEERYSAGPSDAPLPRASGSLNRATSDSSRASLHLPTVSAAYGPPFPSEAQFCLQDPQEHYLPHGPHGYFTPRYNAQHRDESDECIPAILSPTDNPYVFELRNLERPPLLQHPSMVFDSSMPRFNGSGGGFDGPGDEDMHCAPELERYRAEVDFPAPRAFGGTYNENELLTFDAQLAEDASSWR